MSDTSQMKVKVGNYRWVICALLFFATTINYMDRQVIGILRPVLQQEIHWANPANIDIEYGYITTAFTIAYALGVLLFGWFIDKVGTKKGYAISVGIWGLSSLVMHLQAAPLAWVLPVSDLGSENRVIFLQQLKQLLNGSRKKNGLSQPEFLIREQTSVQYWRRWSFRGQFITLPQIHLILSGRLVLLLQVCVILSGLDFGWQFIGNLPRRKN